MLAPFNDEYTMPTPVKALCYNDLSIMIYFVVDTMTLDIALNMSCQKHMLFRVMIGLGFSVP